MLAENLLAPIRSKGLQPTLETLVGIVGLAVVNTWLAPHRPGLLDMQPHPLVMLVMLIAGRYGLVQGVTAALGSAVTLGWVCSQFYIVPDVWAMLQEGTGVPLVSLVTTAIFVGELRDLTLRRYRLVVDEHDILEERFERLARVHTAVVDEKYLLERAILSEQSPLEFTAALVEALDTRDPEKYLKAVVALLHGVSRAGTVTFYPLVDNTLGRAVASSGGPFENELNRTNQVVMLALQTGRVATVADLTEQDLELMALSRVQVVVPVPSTPGNFFGVAVLQDVPLATFSKVRINALEVAGRLAGRLALRLLEQTHGE
ncbi:MAG: hypothetical protein HY814_05050 [Candidatus Riflebacteria bacterium]|nr:hypothetical protein [Candidatus Riflebacteria bacterium]